MAWWEVEIGEGKSRDYRFGWASLAAGMGMGACKVRLEGVGFPYTGEASETAEGMLAVCAPDMALGRRSGYFPIPTLGLE